MNTLPAPSPSNATVSADRLPFSDHGNDIFFAAVSKTRMPMLLTDPNQPDNPIVFVNPAFLELTGYSEPELIGRNCRLLQGPQTSQATISEIRAAVAEGREFTAEIINYRKDGSAFWNGLFISPVLNDAGKLVYFFASQLDISRRREAEEALRQAHKMEALGQLTGGIAHDFNNLLQVMSGYVDFLGTAIARKFDIARLTNPVERMRSTVTKASTLTQQLLAFARKQELRGRTLNLNTRIDSIRELAAHTLGDTTELSVALDVDLKNCELDPSQFETAVLNLLLNARDALQDRGEPRVVIRTGNLSLVDGQLAGFAQLPAGEYVWLSVSDNGAGISQDALAHVMDPFFTTKEEGKGTGLGLSMVYGFVKQSGGGVDIYSEPGHGTTVRLYFPAVRGEAHAPPSAETSKGPAGVERDEVILVVDDRRDVAAVAEMMLQGMGFQTHIAHDAQEALTILQREPRVDLLFTDLIMPGSMNGVALAQEARRKNPRIRILLTTGYADISIARSDVDGTEFPVLHKPYQTAELVKAIEHALRHYDTAG